MKEKKRKEKTTQRQVYKSPKMEPKNGTRKWNPKGNTYLKIAREQEDAHFLQLVLLFHFQLRVVMGQYPAQGLDAYGKKSQVFVIIPSGNYANYLLINNQLMCYNCYYFYDYYNLHPICHYRQNSNM